jgi:redox-sensing transcriptional repressor
LTVFFLCVTISVVKLITRYSDRPVPDPSLRRLCQIYQILDSLVDSGSERVSSSEIGRRLGCSSHIVRKDISYLPDSDALEDLAKLGAGYDALRLKRHIALTLGFDKPVKLCIVGLGRLGSAIMSYDRLSPGGFEIAAGFDSNVNKLEILKSDVELFPSHEIESVVRRKGIQYAIVAVPAEAALEVAGQLVKAGIRGIINFSPVILPQAWEGVFVHNIDIINDIRFMVSHITRQRGDTA